MFLEDREIYNQCEDIITEIKNNAVNIIIHDQTLTHYIQENDLYRTILGTNINLNNQLEKLLKHIAKRCNSSITYHNNNRGNMKAINATSEEAKNNIDRIQEFIKAIENKQLFPDDTKIKEYIMIMTNDEEYEKRKKEKFRLYDEMTDYQKKIK